MSKKLMDMYESETGNSTPDNVREYDSWIAGYHKWLEGKVESQSATLTELYREVSESRAKVQEQQCAGDLNLRTVMPITDTLKLTRTGKFVVSEKTGVQCKDRGHSSYAYHVEIRSPWKLDQMGFLIDHNRIDRVVRDHAQMTPDSCERMCQAICNGIFVELAKHSVPVKSILVRIKPEPIALAWMELIREFE